MKKSIFTIIICLQFASFSFSQSTYFKIGTLNSGIGNIFLDLKQSDDEYTYISTKHFCYLNNSDTIGFCTKISKINSFGLIENDIIIDSLSAGFRRFNLMIDNNKILVTGFKNESNFRGTLLMTFDTSLTFQQSYHFKSSDINYQQNNGIIAKDDSYYLFGHFQNATNLLYYPEIYKINQNSYTTEWYNTYTVTGYKKNSAFDLQVTSDNNLVFISPFDIPGIDTGFDIIKIDTSGQIIQSYTFNDAVPNIDQDPPSFLSSSDGSTYYSTSDYAIVDDVPLNGCINKLDTSMTTLLWSLLIPQHSILNNRSYIVNDFYEATNGDIMICGGVFGEGGGSDHNNSFNLFLSRISPDGELKWLRIYRVPNTLEELPTDIYGKFIAISKLMKIEETSDGHFILGGDSRLDLIQRAGISPDSTFSWILLLNVDENGCIEGEECQEVIILDGIEQYTEKPVFVYGAKWTYEYTTPGTNTNEIIHSYITYEITDSMTINDSLIYIVDNNRGLGQELMYQDREKIYFWDEAMQDWQLTYDFDVNIKYPTSYTNSTNLIETNVVIEPLSLQHFFWFSWDRGFTQVQQATITNNGTNQDTLIRKILVNCGRMSGGLRLGLGQDDENLDYTIGDIRCFENDDFSFNFSTGWPIYPCDTTYTETLIGTSNIQQSTIKISPNPSDGIINITNIQPNTVYKIFDIQGKEIQSGTTSGEIKLTKSGIYIINIKQNNQWFNQKIIIN